MKNDSYVTKKEAYNDTWGITMDEVKEVDAGVDFLREFSPEYRAYFVWKLIRLNKELCKDNKKGMKTLIDLRKGTIEGSDRCPKCMGYIGKQDDYDMEL